MTTPGREDMSEATGPAGHGLQDMSLAPGRALDPPAPPTPASPPSASPPAASPPARPRIVDLVFASPPPRGRRRLAAALVAAAAHAALGLWLLGQGPTLEVWSAELAARVHDELSRVEIVELPPDRPKPPPDPPQEPAPAVAPPTPTAPAARSPAPRTRIKIGDPPAPAGKIVAAPPGPLDLTGEVFVEGQGSAYAGGATSPGGAGTTPARQPGAAPPPPPPPPAPAAAKPRSRATGVSLRSEQWSCPWPDEAQDLPLDEQTATIRVTVRPDGSVEASEVVQDPGAGFAAAALRCARSTRFTPATDADGRPIRAVSPAIRVHFYR